MFVANFAAIQQGYSDFIVRGIWFRSLLMLIGSKLWQPNKREAMR